MSPDGVQAFSIRARLRKLPRKRPTAASTACGCSIGLACPVLPIAVRNRLDKSEGIVMAYMTVNRVRIRSYWTLPIFAWVIWNIYRQARRAPGNLGIRIFRTRGLAVWTTTAWVDEAAMLAFRDSGSHGRARPKKPIWFDEAAITDWHQASGELPTSVEAATRLRTSGRLSHVRHPSPAQAAGEVVID